MDIVIVYTLYSDSAVFIYIVAHAYLYILYLRIVLCPYTVHLQTRTLQMCFFNFLIQNKSLPLKQVKVYIFGSFLVTSSMPNHASRKFFLF